MNYIKNYRNYPKKKKKKQKKKSTQKKEKNISELLNNYEYE